MTAEAYSHASAVSLYAHNGKSNERPVSRIMYNKYKILTFNYAHLLIKRKAFHIFAVWNKPDSHMPPSCFSRKHESPPITLNMNKKVENNINNELQMELSASHTRAFRGSQ